MGARLAVEEAATLTFVSGFVGTVSRLRALVVGLVWSSHLWVVVVLTLFATSCLFQDPPDWGAPKKTRPQLIAPSPTPAKILPVSSVAFDSVNGQKTLHFTCIEKSEDAGDGIRAIWYRNYNSERKEDALFENFIDFPPQHFEDEKEIAFDWDVPVDPSAHEGVSACMSLTLIVTHLSNTDNTNKHLPIDDEYVASITWLLSFNNPNPSEVVCPVTGGAVP